jgi:hypothetical protein
MFLENYLFFKNSRDAFETLSPSRSGKNILAPHAYRLRRRDIGTAEGQAMSQPLYVKIR